MSATDVEDCDVSLQMSKYVISGYRFWLICQSFVHLLGFGFKEYFQKCDEIIKEVIGEVGEKVKDEVDEEVIDEVGEEVKDEVDEEVIVEVGEEVKDEVDEEVKDEVDEEVIVEVGEEVIGGNSGGR
ncbi:hypothetical protein Bpfe_011273 [Biomphalaria pfeifferi]|uniref:Uncharacterized protein n=1 Tax=Biomphalaria pfeifferi TaxID=112525 RepID=A0AAD8BSD0_BIOPF|nr:hypothetical protein Bpfe_011273 [Biomphalaria pfeifferi]